MRFTFVAAGLLLTSLAALAQSSVHGTPFQVGRTFFERPATNSAQFPLLPAVDDVSVTENLPAPYRRRSFLGGMLWGTGELADYYNWADVPPNRDEWYKGRWQQIRLDQQPVFLNPLMVNYNWPPGQFGHDPTRLEPFTSLADGGIYNGYTITNFVFADTNIPPHVFRPYVPNIRRGINLAMPFPYLTTDRGNNPALPGEWARSPLQLQTRPLETFLLVPNNLTPRELQLQQDPAKRYITTAWTPNWEPGQDPPAILVDRMGDWDADLVYQDPQHPFVQTAATDPGQGTYLKLTIANGSPYTWCEMNDVRYAQLFNVIDGVNPARVVTPPAPVPGLPDVQYALLSGNQDDPQRPCPGIPHEPTDLNPSGQQNNFTTAAIFWYRVNPRANDAPVIFSSGTDLIGTDYLQLDFGAAPAKVFFVVALVPVQQEYPAIHPAADLEAARAYAEALGAYAFNFVTHTRLTYSIENKSVARSTFTSTLRPPYDRPGLVVATNTVQALLPHQYQAYALGVQPTNATDVLWHPLDPATAQPFQPALPETSAPLRYWTVRGSLATYLGTSASSNGIATTSFTTRYLHNNFLAAMPPLRWTDEVTASNPIDVVATTNSIIAVPLGDPRTEKVGQIMLDDIATQYMNNTAYGNGPWGTFFGRSTPDSYGMNQAFTRVGQQLGTLQLLSQYSWELDGHVTDRGWFNAAGPVPFYAIPNPRRPGVDPAAALEDSVHGLQDAIARLFGEHPAAAVVNYSFWSGGVKQDGSADIITTTRPNLWNLEYFVRWEKEAGRVLVMPNGSFPAFFFPTRSTNLAGPTPMTYPPPAPQPQRTDPPVPTGAVNTDPPQGIPTDQSAFPYYPGTIWDGFGIGTQFNDHHYNMGYLLAGASLASLYDHAWETNTAVGKLSEWSNAENFGAGLDAIVQTLANDPDNAALQEALYTPDEMRVSFPKFSYFDVWAGHPWASGLTPGPGLDKFGMNENSNYEGNNAWSGIALWGMATGRPAIADLGIFLFTLGTVSGDFYFFDKNGNTVPGNSWSWVPTTTGTDTNAGGVYLPGLTQHDANPLGGTNTVAVGTATAYQGACSIGNFFGGFPQASRLILAYPATPWHLAIGRNASYMRKWADVMSGESYQKVHQVTPGVPIQFQASYSAALDQVVALGGMDHPSNIAPFADPTGKLPLLDYWANLFLGDGTAPHSIGAAGQGMLQPSQTVGTVMHWLLTFDQYGLPDFTIIGHGVSDPDAPASTGDSLVFSAAFTRMVNGSPQSSLFAFNPGTEPVAVNFWRVEDTDQSRPLLQPHNLIVPPKKWARAQYPRPTTVLLAKVAHRPQTRHLTFTVDSDDDVARLHLERSTNLVDWISVPFPPASAGTHPQVEIPVEDGPGALFLRFRLPEPAP